MQFVRNEKKYWEFIRLLRNDKRVKAGFIQQEIVERGQHKEYMSKNGDKFYLCLVEGQPAGYVGVIENDIRVATHPNYQKMGVGLFMIKQITKASPRAIAKVKLENEASVKLFEKAGFKKRYYLMEKDAS
tara:strand:+ start:898 stop:1287 length:390 start_codon:yes stop_codon:yes gene_type:complete